MKHWNVANILCFEFVANIKKIILDFGRFLILDKNFFWTV